MSASSFICFFLQLKPINDPSLHLKSLPDQLPISLGNLREFAGVARNSRTLCPIENIKFQSVQISILTADLKSTEKTDKRKCFSFFKIPSGTLSKLIVNIRKKGKFNYFIYKLKGKGIFANFNAKFEHLLAGIFEKGKHFLLSVFSVDFKSVVKIGN